MKKSTKILSLLMSLVMVMGVFTAVPSTVSAADAEVGTAGYGATSGTTGDCTWRIEGTKLIISGSGRMGSYDGVAPWCEFYIDDGDKGCGITEAVIEDGVTSIGKKAFCNCRDLKKVTIGNTATGIGINAFSNCESLTRITLPRSVTLIASGAFAGCSNLQNVTILGSVTDIGSYAFAYCSALTSIDLPDSVTSLGEYAFEYCSSLSAIHLPGSLSVIEYDTFTGCSALTSVVIPNSVTTIHSDAFYGCTMLESVTLSDSLTEIYCAFYNLPRLKSITIPASVRFIDDNTFGYYEDEDFGTSMKVDGFTIYGYEGRYNEWGEYYESEAKRYAEKNGFTFVSLGGAPSPSQPGELPTAAPPSWPTEPDNPDCTSSLEGTVLTISGSGKMNNYQDNNYYTSSGYSQWRNYSITEAVIEDGITTVSKSAFYGCTELEKVTIGNSVMGIARNAFDSCEKLTDITLPDSLEIIGSDAFYDCSGLKNINIPDGVTDIGAYAFYNCRAMRSATIPASVTNIDDKAFGYYWDDEFGLARKLPGFKIYGDAGSEAQRYAKAFGFTFERAIVMTGDADGDGAVTVMDASEVQRSLSALNTISDEDITLYADVDRNDQLEIVDATWIQRSVAKIDIPYEVGQIISNRYQ